MTLNSKPKRILCFGDSITYGAWDVAGGWVDLLKRHYHKEFLDNKQKVQVYNLGIGGETSGGLLKRIEQEIIARTSTEWETVIIIAIGKNDTRAVSETTNYESDPETYRQNLLKIITISKIYSNKILLIGLGVANEKLSFKNLDYTNDRMEVFDEINLQIALSTNIPRIDLHKRMLANPHFNEMYFDRVHPNNLGHKWFFEQIQPEIQKLIQ